MIQRVAVPLLLAAAVVTGAWLLWSHGSAPPPPVVEPTATPSSSPTPTVAVNEQTRAHRLAGTAVGDRTSWAAIERPDGSSRLYRTGEQVSELGEIVAIHADHIVVRGEGGEFRLNLKPAPTPTPERRRWSGDSELTPPDAPASDGRPRE